jgi:hypothetical protein
MTWDKSRAKLIDIAVTITRRGYDIAHVTQGIASRHYHGKSPAHATVLLARDARRVYWQRHASRTEAQERELCQIEEMATVLREEGWRLLEIPSGCIWHHAPTSNEVNRNGGVFEIYGAATRATFESATRATLLGLAWRPAAAGNSFCEHKKNAVGDGEPSQLDDAPLSCPHF